MESSSLPLCFILCRPLYIISDLFSFFGGGYAPELGEVAEADWFLCGSPGRQPYLPPDLSFSFQLVAIAGTISTAFRKHAAAGLEWSRMSHMPRKIAISFLLSHGICKNTLFGSHDSPDASGQMHRTGLSSATLHGWPVFSIHVEWQPPVLQYIFETFKVSCSIEKFCGIFSLFPQIPWWSSEAVPRVWSVDGLHVHYGGVCLKLKKKKRAKP